MAFRKPRSDASKEAQKRYRSKPEVKARIAEYQKRFRAETSYYSEWHLKTEYGLTLEEFMELSDKQGGVCAICGGVNPHKLLCVDHDHITGEIRGLLCDPCNRGLGMFKDDPKLLKVAVRYLGGVHGI